MTSSIIPWERINEKIFEEICLCLAEEDMPNLIFELYLKKGNKQEGIDILANDLNSCKNICLQCKHYIGIPKIDLKTAIKEFEDGQFFHNTNKFIIATTADLQTQNFNKYTRQETTRFKNEYNIELQWWDRGVLENKLKKCYRLVSFYFKKDIADNYCFPNNRQSPNIHQPVENYIERKVLILDEIKNTQKSDEDRNFRFYLEIKDSINLIDLFLKDYNKTQRICLIGDAYQGKSTLLQQLAYDLATNEIRFVPIFIKIKAHTLRPIESILDESYSFWKIYPFRETIIILDGLDEVSKDKFLEAHKYIIEFSNANKSINIIFSCRKLFYSHYKIYDDDTVFKFYELFPLQHDQIEDYLDKILGNSKKSFENYIANYHLNNFLYQPSYLAKLARLYVDSLRNAIRNFPKNKEEIIYYLVGESFKSSKKRLLIDGDFLEHKESKYTICITKLALTCQILGLNTMDYKVIEGLFDSSEIELLLNSSILTKEGGKWTFENAFFQENLAAIALTYFSYDEIIELITVGKKYRKIKTKWIQTITSYISLSDREDEKRTKLLDLIEKDNIELITLCDSSKFDIQFKLDVLTKIIQRCRLTNSFPQLSYVDVIANFIKDDKQGLSYFLPLIKTETNEIIKSLYWRIIYHFDNIYTYKNEFVELILIELQNTEDSNFARLMINILQKFNLANEEIINKLITYDKFIDSYEYIDNLYSLIIDNNLVDKYYYLGLMGIDKYANYNRGSLSLFAEKNLEKFLLNIINPTNYIILLRKIASKDWDSFYNNIYSSNDKKPLYTELCTKAIQTYNTDELVVFPIIEIALKLIHHHYNNDDYKIIFDFFNKTGTNLFFIKLYFLRNKVIDIFNLSLIISEEGFEYVLYEFEEGRLSEIDLRNLFFYIVNWAHNESLANKFHVYIREATGYNFLNQEQDDRILKHQNFENKKNENDLKFIQSQETFIEGLKLYFNAYGSNSITDNDLSFSFSDNAIKRNIDSRFIYLFLIDMKDNNKNLSLNTCINAVKKTDWFNEYRASLIFNYTFPSQESKDVLVPILKEYYDKEIQIAVFQNSIIQKGTHYSNKYKEHFLTDIYSKFFLRLLTKY